MPLAAPPHLKTALQAGRSRLQRRSLGSPAQRAWRKEFGETWGKTGTAIGKMIRGMGE